MMKNYTRIFFLITCMIFFTQISFASEISFIDPNEDNIMHGGNTVLPRMRRLIVEDFESGDKIHE